MKDLLNSLRGGDDKEMLKQKIKKQVSELPEKTETNYTSSSIIAPLSLLYALKISNNDCSFLMKDNKIFQLDITVHIGSSREATIKDLSKAELKKQITLIDEGIQRCKKHNKIPILYLTIIPYIKKKRSSSRHANILIFNWKRNEVERYEPYGSGDSEFMRLMIKTVNKYLSKTYKDELNKFKGYDFKYVAQMDEGCPIGLQQIENKLKDKNFIIGQKSGYCMMWSSFYASVRLEFPLLSQEDIINTIYDAIDNDQKTLMRYIVNYSRFVENLLKEWGVSDHDYKFYVNIIAGKSGKKVSQLTYTTFMSIEQNIQNLINENTTKLIKEYTSNKPPKKDEPSPIKDEPAPIRRRFEEPKKDRRSEYNELDIIMDLRKRKQQKEEQKMSIFNKELNKLKERFKQEDEEGNKQTKNANRIMKKMDKLIKTRKEQKIKQKISDREKELNEMKERFKQEDEEGNKQTKKAKRIMKKMDKLMNKDTPQKISDREKELNEMKERIKQEDEEGNKQTKKAKRIMKKMDKLMNKDTPQKKKKERIKKPKKPRVRMERMKMDIDHNSIFSKYNVPMLNDMIKNFLGNSKGLSYMNKGYKIHLLKNADIDLSLLPPIPERGQKRYGISKGIVKPYDDTEQEKFMKTNYSELHPLMAKKLDPVKHKRQYEMNLNIDLNSHQKSFIVNFINSYFRGGLLFHSVGAGKTLTAVAFSHYYLSLYPDRNVVIISPPTLLFNFVEAMMEYGLDIRDNRFQFHTYIKYSKNWKNYVNDKTLLIIDEIHNFRNEIQMGVSNVDGKDVSVVVHGALQQHILDSCRNVHKVLGMSGTPFVNRLYDIENQMAMIGHREPLSDDAFKKVVDNENLTFDYFKHRISHFDIFKTDMKKFFPDNRTIYVPIIVPNKPPFSSIYRLVATGHNPYEDDVKEAKYQKRYLISLDYRTPDGKEWTPESNEDGTLTHTYEKAPEMDFWGRKGHLMLQTIAKEDEQGRKLTKEQLKKAPREMAEGNKLKSFYNAGRQFGNIVDGLKVKFIVDKIKKNPTFKSIVFSSFIESSLNPLRMVLTEEKIKFTLITGSEVALTRQKNKELFNDINSGVNVLLISSAGTEGVSTKNVKQLFVFESQWNEALTEQAIARAIRFKSHSGLPPEENYVNVYRLQLVLSEDDKQSVEDFNSGKYQKQAYEDMDGVLKRNKLFNTILEYIKKKFEAYYYKKKVESDRNQRESHRTARWGIGQKKPPYTFNQEKFEYSLVNDYVYKHETGEEINPIHLKTIDEYIRLDEKLKESVVSDITKLKTVSSDITLTKISIIKEVIIKDFIKRLDAKVPQIESFKEPLHAELIKAIDEEKDVSKLLQKQRDILDKIGNKVLEMSERVNNIIVDSESAKMNKMQETIKKKSEVSAYNEFFTPPEIASELLSYSDIIKSNDTIKVLEPTAGFGSLVRAVIGERLKVRDNGTFIDMCEINEPNRKVLQNMYVDNDPYQYNLLQTKNFLEYEAPEAYDLIVMNPPFHLKKALNLEILKNDVYDIDFVIRAYSMLKPGGELLGVVSSYLSHGKSHHKKWITYNNVMVIKEYRGYKWSPTKEKEEKGKKSTKLTLSFDLIYMRKPEEDKPEEDEPERKAITTKRKDYIMV
jgi:hypothetical protein